MDTVPSKKIPWNKGLVNLPHCYKCEIQLKDYRSKYCKKCRPSHPNSLKNLKPKSAKYLKQHPIHLGKKHSEESKRKISENRRGKALREKNSRWNNGQSMTTSGYKSILIGISTPHKLEHRWVVEKAIGRNLSWEEVIHHINGNKLDNRLENLQILSRKEHAKIHAHRRREVYAI